MKKISEITNDLFQNILEILLRVVYLKTLYFIYLFYMQDFHGVEHFEERDLIDPVSLIEKDPHALARLFGKLNIESGEERQPLIDAIRLLLEGNRGTIKLVLKSE